MLRYPLHPHPKSPQPELGPNTDLSVQLTPTHTHWQLHYCLHAEPGKLRLPKPHPAPGPADGLWQHSCFELFVGQADSTAYLEFNFSPSGQWAAYAFSAQRQRAVTPPDANWLAGLRLAPQPQADGFVLDVQLPLGILSLLPATTQLHLGLCAVLEDHVGQLSHWALHHPQAQADFHHPGGWLARSPTPLQHNP